MAKASKKPKLGSGKRFSDLTSKIEKEGKSAKVAKKIAASVGRKKYGAKKMGELSRHKTK
jgi:hypothetical protein